MEKNSQINGTSCYTNKATDLNVICVTKLLYQEATYEDTLEQSMKTKEITSVRTVIKHLLKIAILTKHLRNVHENRRDYQCENCDEAFSSQQNLTYHEIVQHNMHILCQNCFEMLANRQYDVNYPVKYMHDGRNCFCQRQRQ